MEEITCIVTSNYSTKLFFVVNNTTTVYNAPPNEYYDQGTLVKVTII